MKKNIYVCLCATESLFCIAEMNNIVNQLYVNKVIFLWLRPHIWKFLGQWLNPSHSCNLWCKCSNARSFNRGLNLHVSSDPSHCSWIPNPLSPSKNSNNFFFKWTKMSSQRMYSWSSYRGLVVTNLRPMRTWVRSLAMPTQSGIQHFHELWCKSQMWFGSGIDVAVV